MFNEFTDEENILRHFTRLDQVQCEYESRWGVSRLPNLVSKELKEKWDGQIAKLHKARIENNLFDVIALVEGCIRGFAVLEKEALSLGHKMHDAEMWDVKHPTSGKVYRIVKNNYDAGISLNDDALVYTLHEVACILESAHFLNNVKQVFPDAQVVSVFKTEKEEKDFFNDNLPF